MGIYHDRQNTKQNIFLYVCEILKFYTNHDNNSSYGTNNSLLSTTNFLLDTKNLLLGTYSL